MFTDEIVAAARAYDPARITHYVITLATLFHSFYNACPHRRGGRFPGPCTPCPLLRRADRAAQRAVHVQDYGAGAHVMDRTDPFSPLFLADGPSASQMYGAGMAWGESPAAWALAHPAFLQEQARRFAAAGVHGLLLPTLRANAPALASWDLSPRADELNEGAGASGRGGGWPPARGRAAGADGAGL